MGLSTALFGYNVLAIELPSLISLVSMIVLTYLIGREIKGYPLGLVSALFVALAPISVSYATRVLPDLTTGMFAALVIYLILLTKHSSHPNLISAIVGALVALMIAIRMESLIFVILLIFSLLIYAFHEIISKDRNMLRGHEINIKFVIIGFAVVFSLILVYFYYYSGRILYWLFAYSKAQVEMAPSTLSQNINFIAVALNPYTFLGGIKGTTLASYFYPMGLLLDLALIGGIIFIACRKWEMMTISIITVGVILYLFFGTKTLSKLEFMTPQDRFLMIVLPFIAVISGYLIIMVYDAIRRYSKPLASFTAITIIIYILVSNIPVYFVNYRYNLTSAFTLHAYKGIISYIHGFRNANVYCVGANPGLSCMYLQFLSAYRSGINFATPSTYSQTHPVVFVVYTDFNGVHNNATTWIGSDYSIDKVLNYSETNSQIYVNLYQVSANK
ncbi:MAG: ArnT family glycosyltransferase [Candidatus Micrarchaeia archaeon]